MDATSEVQRATMCMGLNEIRILIRMVAQVSFKRVRIREDVLHR
jgi:hypothetical protein